MSIFQAAVLGILQGLTEFFPVSSSGHLVIFQSFLREFNQPGVLFDVILHAGTMFAVLVYFRNKIIKLDHNYLKFIAIASIPVFVIGLFFSSQIEILFKSIKLTALALLITGGLNILTDRLGRGKKLFSSKNVFFIGIFQSISLIPGISRSGSTIFAGVFKGIKREDAAAFSFLLSVPAIFAANLFQIVKFSPQFQDNILIYLIGFVASFASGFLAIKYVISLLKKNMFKYFGYYCLILGILLLLLIQ